MIVLPSRGRLLARDAYGPASLTVRLLTSTVVGCSIVLAMALWRRNGMHTILVSIITATSLWHWSHPRRGSCAHRTDLVAAAAFAALYCYLVNRWALEQCTTVFLLLNVVAGTGSVAYFRSIGQWDRREFNAATAHHLVLHITMAFVVSYYLAQAWPGPPPEGGTSEWWWSLLPPDPSPVSFVCQVSSRGWRRTTATGTKRDAA